MGIQLVHDTVHCCTHFVCRDDDCVHHLDAVQFCRRYMRFQHSVWQVPSRSLQQSDAEPDTHEILKLCRRDVPSTLTRRPQAPIRLSAFSLQKGSHVLPFTKRQCEPTDHSVFILMELLSVRQLTLRLLMSYIYIYIYIYMEHPFLMFLDHTQQRTTVGRTPLDE